MRNALILLVVVALIIVVLGAANGSITFDFDLVFGTWTAVSLVWMAVVVAAVVVVAGLAAAWLAQVDAARTRRKLEAELQATYERLRAAEAGLPQEEPQEVSAALQQAAEAPETAGAAEPPVPQDPAPPSADAPRDETSAAVPAEGAAPGAG